jgi:hypothetical protein
MHQKRLLAQPGVTSVGIERDAQDQSAIVAGRDEGAPQTQAAAAGERANACASKSSALSAHHDDGVMFVHRKLAEDVRPGPVGVLPAGPTLRSIYFSPASTIGVQT